jgi:hypothetical protein
MDTIHQYILESLLQFTSYTTITKEIIMSVFYIGLKKITMNATTNTDKIVLSVY